MSGAGVGFGPFFMQSQAASGAEQCLPAGLIRTALSSSKYEVLVWQPMHYVSTYVPIDQMRVYKSAGGRNDPPYPSHSRGGGGNKPGGGGGGGGWGGGGAAPYNPGPPGGGGGNKHEWADCGGVLQG